MVNSERDKLAQCEHNRRPEGPRWFKRCADCGELLSLGEADEPGADVAAGRLLAMHGGLAEDENLYLHDGGAIAVTTGDQDDAMAWSLDRPIAEQIAAGGDAAAVVRCDWHAEHGADDKPTGQRCESAATHRIVWLDGSGRFSLGCGAHLELDAKAPPVHVERLDGIAGEARLGFDLSDTELVAAIAHSPPREPIQVNVQFEEADDGCGNVEKIAVWSPPIETPLELHLGSCDTLTDRAFPCSCKLLREQHSSPAGPPTSENCKLLGAETCTHDHTTEAETVQTFGVSMDGELG